MVRATYAIVTLLTAEFKASLFFVLSFL